MLYGELHTNLLHLPLSIGAYFLRISLSVFSFMIYIILAYEYGLLEETEKAIEILRTGEEKFSEILQRNKIARNLSPAFLHVLKSTEVYLLQQKEDICLALKVRV